MQISGFLKNSFIDFPGRISSVIFSSGCNMNCWYCHNKNAKPISITFEDVMEFLQKRRGLIEGVVFSGGEVTLQSDLEECIKKVKAEGFLVKLDTNGTNPEILKKLIEKKLLDFIAMDIKAPFEKYEKIAGRVDLEKIKKSIEIIKKSGIEHEFRTTFSPDLIHSDIREIAKIVQGGMCFAIQQYRQSTVNGELEQRPHSPEYLKQAAEIANAYIKTIVKGV